MMDKNGRIDILGIVFVLAAVVLSAAFVIADTQCTSQDCSVAASVTVGNAVPTIPWVESGITITGTAESSKTAYVLFNASDNNGYADLNDTTAQCIGYKSGETNRTSTSCTAQNQSGNDLTYNCSVSFQYYDDDGADWRWDCSVSDNSVASVNNDTGNFTINALNYVDVNVTTVSWSSVNPNVDDQEASAPINLDNGGNQDYETATVTAYDAVNSSNIITAGNFSLDTDTGQTTGQTYMVNATATAITSWFTLPRGAASNENLYTYADVPSLTSGTYVSTNNWLIDITA